MYVKKNIKDIAWIKNNPKTYSAFLSGLNEASDFMMGVPFIDKEENIINESFEKEVVNVLQDYDNELCSIIYPLNSLETLILRKKLSTDKGLPLKSRTIACQIQKSTKEVDSILRKVYKKLLVRIYFAYHLVNNHESLIMAYYKGYILLDEILNMPLKFILATNTTFLVKDLTFIDSNKVYKFLGEDNFRIYANFIHELGICFPDEDRAEIFGQLVDGLDRKMSRLASDMEGLVSFRNKILGEKRAMDSELIREYSNKNSSYFN